MKKFYVAGPMTGHVGFNYEAFHKAEAILLNLGHECFNPARIANGDTTKKYSFYIKEGLKGLLECTDILLLPRWGDSAGAKLEAHVAKKLELPGWQIKDGKLIERLFSTEIYSLI